MTAPVFDDEFCEAFDRLLAWRRDVRHFRPDPVDRALVEVLLDRAALAPSVGNAQPTRFVRIVSPFLRSAIADHVDTENSQAAAAYASAEQRAAYSALKLHGLREAPEHIAVFCDKAPAEGAGLGRRTMPETLHYSAVLAVHTLSLAARARGIGLGWVSILEPTKVAALLGVPASWRLTGYLCLGYPEVESDTPELARVGWQARIGAEKTRFER